MKWVNDRRLELQQEYHLADDRTEAFQRARVSCSRRPRSRA